MSRRPRRAPALKTRGTWINAWTWQDERGIQYVGSTIPQRVRNTRIAALQKVANKSAPPVAYAEPMAVTPSRNTPGPKLAARDSGKDCGLVRGRAGDSCVYELGHAGEHFDGKHRWHDPKPKKPDALTFVRPTGTTTAASRVPVAVSGPQLDLEEEFRLPSYAQRTTAPPPPRSENERDRNTGNRSVVSFRLRTSTLEALDRLVARLNADCEKNSAAVKTTKTWVVETLLRDHLKKEGVL